ncbi:hypothetical protein OIU35_12670 [Boseaceae bacterium BT-24-1]|nr:hypothetical protein [Boseaceae bacterium BT-24-1]
MKIMVLKLLRLIAILPAPMVLWQGHCAADEPRFQLTLAWTVEEVEPEPRTRHHGLSMQITLRSGGRISETFRRIERRRGLSRLQEGGLGDDLEGRLPGRWKVVNGQTLVRLSAEPSHTFAIWLRTDGQKSCTATLEWRLKAGFRAFERHARRRDTVVRFRQPQVEAAACEVL